MKITGFTVALFIALVMNLAWRWRFPLPGFSRLALVGCAIAGAAVGVFAGILIGGITLGDSMLWQFVAVPIIAAFLCGRLQSLAQSWSHPSKEGA